MLCLSALLDCSFFYGISVEQSVNSDIFILFLSPSYNSGQVAVLGKERKKASLSWRYGLSLRVLIDKGTLYR